MAESNTAYCPHAFKLLLNINIILSTIIIILDHTNAVFVPGLPHVDGECPGSTFSIKPPDFRAVIIFTIPTSCNLLLDFEYSFVLLTCYEDSVFQCDATYQA